MAELGTAPVIIFSTEASANPDNPGVNVNQIVTCNLQTGNIDNYNPPTTNATPPAFSAPVSPATSIIFLIRNDAISNTQVIVWSFGTSADAQTCFTNIKSNFGFSV